MDTSSPIPSQPRIRPSAVWYAVAAVLMVGGLLLTVRAGFDAADRVASSYHELTPGTERTIDLDAGAHEKVYAVWNDQAPSVGSEVEVGARSSTSEGHPPTTVTITDPDGASVPFRPTDRSTTSRWSIDERSGVVVGSFDVTRSGAHRIKVTFGATSASAGPPAKAAVGSFSIFAELRRVIAPVVLGFILGMLLIVVTAVARGRAKRRRRFERLSRAGVDRAPATGMGLGDDPASRRPPPPPPPLPNSGSGGPITFH